MEDKNYKELYENAISIAKNTLLLNEAEKGLTYSTEDIRSLFFGMFPELKRANEDAIINKVINTLKDRTLSDNSLILKIDFVSGDVDKISEISTIEGERVVLEADSDENGYNWYGEPVYKKNPLDDYKEDEGFVVKKYKVSPHNPLSFAGRVRIETTMEYIKEHGLESILIYRVEQYMPQEEAYKMYCEEKNFLGSSGNITFDEWCEIKNVFIKN